MPIKIDGVDVGASSDSLEECLQQAGFAENTEINRDNAPEYLLNYIKNREVDTFQEFVSPDQATSVSIVHEQTTEHVPATPVIVIGHAAFLGKYFFCEPEYFIDNIAKWPPSANNVTQYALNTFEAIHAEQPKDDLERNL